jgi:hypothetical protein
VVEYIVKVLGSVPRAKKRKRKKERTMDIFEIITNRESKVCDIIWRQSESIIGRTDSEMW